MEKSARVATPRGAWPLELRRRFPERSRAQEPALERWLGPMAAVLAMLAAACASTDSGSSDGSGASPASGGAVATGGSPTAGGMTATGGVSPLGTGGQPGSGGGGFATGGASPGGWTDSGGTTTGGALTGGAPTGGWTGSSGAPTGGAPTGGTTTGGAPTGGTQTGGALTGGTPTGGASTGGASTGGASTGGASTGGALTGGAPTGGLATGGGSTGGMGTAGDSGTGGAPGVEGPCDIFESAATPCVGAWSTARALYGTYSGSLYQVQRTSDGATTEIPVLSPGGIADSSVQDAFCTGDCIITVIYDQSPRVNDLFISRPVFWLEDGGVGSNAAAARITLGGHPVYGVKFVGAAKNSYRTNNPNGTATGDEAETLYEVIDSKVYNQFCCNSFGNAETTGNPDGEATMEAIYFGNCEMFGGGSGDGPWLLADLEAGTFPSNQKWDESIPPFVTPAFGTLMLKGFSGNRFALKGGDAQSGALFTQWDGARPAGYSPMKKQGDIVLGTGGDGSFYSTGVFFEGAVTIGCADDDSVDDAIQANIVAAGYGR